MSKQPDTPSKERILELVTLKGEFKVHRYSVAHEKLRKRCRRMMKDGHLKLDRLEQPFWVYVLSAKKESNDVE